MYSQLKRLALPIAIVLNVAMYPTQGFAQISQPDARVKAALDAGSSYYQYKYQVDKDGDFVISAPVGNGRTQRGIIMSKTEKYKKMEFREILSVVHTLEKELPGSVAIKLLQDSRTRKLGSWRVVKTTGTQHVIVFSTKIPVRASSEEIIHSLNYILVSADQMESELTNGKNIY